MTERLHFHFSLLCTGEGNGNPLQCSCLENPRDWGTWLAAVCGVAQSRTRLKRLSSIYILYVYPLSGQAWGALWRPGLAACVLNQVQLFVTPWTVAHQAPLSMEFSRQECWSGCHFLLQGIFPTQGLNPFLLQIYCIGRQDSLLTVPPRKPSKKFLPPAVPRGLEFSVKLWNYPGKNTGVGRHSFLWGNLPNPGIEPQSPVLQADALLSEPQRKSQSSVWNCRSRYFYCDCDEPVREGNEPSPRASPGK